MPLIRSFIFKYYALLIVSIFLNKEIMNPYSYYKKKRLVYIILMTSFSYQPFSYLECTKINTYLLYNICSIPLNKYIYLTVHY